MLPSDRLVEALARLYQYAKSPPATRPAPLTVAVTRQAGSRGAAIARAVGARLSWPVYDHELLTRIAAEKGLSARLFEHLDERCISWVEELFAGFSARSNTLEGVYLKQLLQLLASLGQAGHCVIVGRGAAQVLPAETTLRVRVLAPRVLRVSEVERREGLSKAEAERWVDQTDAGRAAFVKAHFSKDAADPLNYDLILNSGRLGTDECAELIAQAARLREARAEAAAAVRHTA
jgi:cytidylate kinase